MQLDHQSIHWQVGLR